LLVKATNQFGSDSKQIKVVYEPHAEIKLPPIITFINPSTTTSNSSNPNYTYSVTIANMINQQQGITAKFNGVNISNYTFDGLNLVYNAILASGNNVLEISATNSDGTDSKSVLISYRAKSEVRAPIITILQPTETPTVNVRSYEFKFRGLYVTKSQIEVLVNNSPITDFNFVNLLGSFSYSLVNGNNTILVKATNDNGTVSKTEIVVFKESDTHHHPDTSTPSELEDNKKVIICHKDDDPKKGSQTITVSQSAVSQHLSHGDTRGECPRKDDDIKVNHNELDIKENLEEDSPNIKQDSIIIQQQPVTPRKPR